MAFIFFSFSLTLSLSLSLSLIVLCIIDPYAVVSIGCYSQPSRVVPESLYPTWDQTLIFENISFYGDLKMMKKFPPQIVIELFDMDQMVRKLQMLKDDLYEVNESSYCFGSVVIGSC